MQACKKREKKSDVFLKEKFQMKKRTAYCRKGSVSSLTIGCSMHALTTTGTLCSLPLGLEGGARNSRRLIPSLQKVIRYRKPPSRHHYRMRFLDFDCIHCGLPTYILHTTELMTFRKAFKVKYHQHLSKKCGFSFEWRFFD